MNEELAKIKTLAVNLQYPSVKLTKVDAHGVPLPFIPRTAGAASEDTYKYLFDKVMGPLLDGIGTFIEDYFPCNEDLYQAELDALTTILDNGNSAIHARKQFLESTSRVDKIMRDAMTASDEVIQGAGGSGYPIAPGFANGAVMQIHADAMRKAAAAHSEVTAARQNDELA
jgi:hypothetical protein